MNFNSKGGSRYFYPAHIQTALHLIKNLSVSENEAERRLLENCRRAGLRVHGQTPADGNCFFHAVSNQLSLLGLSHQSAAKLRRDVVVYLKNHPQIEGPDGVIDFKSYIQSDWATYLESMSRDGEWADAVVLVAMARMLRRDIMVVTSSPEGTDNQAFQWIVGDENFSGTPVRLGHIWELHYVSLDSMVSQPESSAAPTTSLKDSNPSPSTTASHNPKIGRQKRKRNTEETSHADSAVVQPESTTAPMTPSKESNPSSSTTASHNPKIGRQKRKRNTEETSHADSAVVQPESTTAPMTPSKESNHSSTTASHNPKIGRQKRKRNTEETSHAGLRGDKSNAVPVSEADFRDITNSLGPDELHHLLHNLGIKNRDIENAEKGADTNDPRLKARAVLRWWKQREGKKATRKALFEAKHKIHRDRESLGGKSPLLGKICKWKQQLKEIYLQDRQEIRFGRGSSHVANIEDLYVDLELIEERGKQGKGGRPHSGKGKGLDSDKGLGRSTDSNMFNLSDKSRASHQLLNNPTHSISVIGVGDIEINPNRKKLGSYHDLFKIKIRNRHSNHLLLFGAAGSGKTTQINKIAYEWAEKIENGSTNFSPEELPIHVGMELVFVLDMHKFQSNETLAEAVKRQLLTEATTEDIEHVFGQLGFSCLIIFDAFDEIPKGVTNHPLDLSPQVKNLFVIITTRYHMKDLFCRKYTGYSQIQVCGFSSGNVAKYIKRYFENMEVKDLASSLIEKVNESLLLQALSSLPVLLVMICLVWEKSNKCGDTLHSMTNLYKEFMTKQYLNKPFEDKDILSDQEIKNLIQAVGKTALVALFENSIVMQEGNIDKHILNHAFDLGLMIRDDGKLPGDTSISFIHKTFQEYCAAVYMCSLFDLDKVNFQSYLDKINKGTIDRMEYMLRFCCGLSLAVAEAIFKHVVCKVKTEKNPLKVPLMLLYEVELTHDLHLLNQDNLHKELKLLCVSTYIDVPDADFLAALVHFTREKYFPNMWLSHITYLNITYKHVLQQNIMQILYSMPSLESATVGVQALTSEHIPPDNKLLKLTYLDLSVSQPFCLTSLTALLPCMPALKTLKLRVVELIEDIQYSGKCVPFSKCLTELWLMRFDSGKVLDVSVELLLSLLSCMPALTGATLWNVHLTDDFDVNHVTLSESVKEIVLADRFPDRVYNVNVTQLVSFLSCMPALTTVILQDTHLTGDLDDNHVTLSESLRELLLVGYLPESVYNVNVTQLVSFLSCMPALTKVILQDTHLTGDLDDKHVTLSESLREFVMLCYLPDRVYNVNVIQLVSFLSCMPALKIVILCDAHLTGDLDHNHVTLSESVEEFELIGRLSDRAYIVNVIQLVSVLSCMPALTKVTLQDAHLTGELDANHVTLNELLREFVLVGYRPESVYNVNVTQLVSFLSYMQVLAKVTLQDTHLTGDLDDNHVTLSESVKEFELRVRFPDRVYNVNVTQLSSFLSCMPALAKVILQDAHLTGDFDDNHVTLSELLRECKLISYLPDRVYNVNVTQLVSFLNCMPALAKLTLQDAHLTGNLDDNHVTLSESLTELALGGNLPESVYNVNVTQLVSFLSCMPALAKVTLQDSHLTGDLDVNHLTLSESLRECKLEGFLHYRVYNVNITQLVSFISCMPALAKVALQDTHLTGDLDDIHVTLSESLRELVLVGSLPDIVYSVNGKQLVSFLSCMPALTKVALQDAHLTGDFDDNHVTLSESLRELLLVGYLPESVYNVNVTQLIGFLSCMPALAKVTLQDAHLTGDFDDNHVTLSESLRELLLVGYLPESVYNVNVTQLIGFLSCMPALAKVTLQDAHLTGDFDDNHVTLSESLRELVLVGNLPESVYNVNVTQLIGFLSCMPALAKVTLENAHNLIAPIDSVKQFNMCNWIHDKAFSVDVWQLVKCLSCFSSIESVSLHGIQLTGELEGKSVCLSESIKEVWVSSSKKESNINLEQLVNFLSCMPSLGFVGLHDIQLIGSMGGTHVMLSKSLHRIVIGRKWQENAVNVNVTKICSILSCMPSLEQVKLTNVHLTGEVKETCMKLSESLKELWISGCDKGCPDLCGGEWCVDDVKEQSCKEKGDGEDEKAHSDKETGEQGEEKENGDEGFKVEMKKKDDCVQELSHDNKCSVCIRSLQSFLQCMQSSVCVKLNRVAVQGTLDEDVNNILPVQEFSCVDCIISPQVLSKILAQGNSVRSLQLTGVNTQFEEDEVMRIFTTDRLASLKVLKLDDSISKTFSGVHHIVNNCLRNLQELYPVIHNKDDQSALFDFILDYCSRELGDSSLPLQKFGIFSDIRDMFSKFMSVLQCMPNLRGLDLRRVGLQAEHFQKLAAYLSSVHVQHFQEMSISDTDLAQLMPLLVHTNLYLCNLSTLKLRKVGLTDDGINQLPWSKLSQLTELDLSCNNIGSEGAVIFSDMIRTDCIPLLQHLNLGKNAIGSEGMSALAKTFSHLHLMKILNLACDMVVRPQALEDVFRNLVHMSCLEVLDLRGPHVGDEDWKQFPVLVDCCRLLYWDPITKQQHVFISIVINRVNRVIKMMY